MYSNSPTEFSYYYELLPGLDRVMLFKKFIGYLEDKEIKEKNTEAKKIFLELLIIINTEKMIFDNLNDRDIQNLKRLWKGIFPKFNKTRFYDMRFARSLDWTYNEEEAIIHLFLLGKGKMGEFMQALERDLNIAEYNKVIYLRKKAVITGPISSTSDMYGFLTEILPFNVKFSK
jgi:hypothetical protein